MRSVLDEAAQWIPMSAAEQDKVREQMNRLLETNHFKNSKRYPALFRFIVEETLEGRGEYLKERLLGIRVFDRPADYDTATDPIVRVTIAEIRKRIAQYYHDEAHDAEMRIELLPGHYAPEFRFRKEADHDRLAQVGVLEVHHPVPAQTTVRSMTEAGAEVQARPSVAVGKPGRKSRTWLAFAALVMVLLCAGCTLLWRAAHPSALEQFWGPVLAGRKPVLLCIPTGAGKTGGMAAFTSNDLHARPGVPFIPGGPTFLDHESLEENVVFSDVLAMMKVGGLLATREQEYRPRLNISTSLEDLREGPAVLIGGMDNQWTLEAIVPLRYRFAGSDATRYWISDSTNPAQKDWSLDLKTKLVDVRRDYAIVARLHSEQTGQMEVVVAGIGMAGTAAAGEFVVDPQQLEGLRQKIGKDFATHDFEAVLGTDVINGIAGSPKVLAVWVR